MKPLVTGHGELPLPAFLPDATRGAIRTLDSADVAACGVEALMVNALHLSSHPGTTAVSAMGGIHRFMGWPGPVASDSGGYQVFSLIDQSANLGSVTARGFSYRLAKGQSKRILTPEKAIQKQFQLGADIMFCLDHCTHPEADADIQRESVEHTIDWARRCRDEFDRRVEQRRADGGRPLLFAVIQGGHDPGLRRLCAERLFEIGFDGYGYGGWPIYRDGTLVEMVAYVAELVPEGIPKHALGIGKPGNVVRCVELGFQLFDCSIPTRDARHKRLYVFTERPDEASLAGDAFYRNLYIGDDEYSRDARPLDDTCDCLCCSRYSRGYVHHLFAVGDALAHRLATIHNLRFYARLMERLRAAAGTP